MTLQGHVWHVEMVSECSGIPASGRKVRHIDILTCEQVVLRSYAQGAMEVAWALLSASLASPLCKKCSYSKQCIPASDSSTCCYMKQQLQLQRSFAAHVAVKF